MGKKMTYIKKVEIFGFKSFGFENTTIQFELGLVSISGANGSGKTNILDAIIFAMGENKPKVMRVDKLQDLIHNSKENRRGTKMARTSVHFDNSDRKISVDTDVVEITREMDVNGDSVYYLNKKKSNRSHILDLLDDANIELDQLNTMQQGTVTRISEFTSKERRKTIEYFIGLSYFDDKKSKSIKQLGEADDKLESVLAKLYEIKKKIDKSKKDGNQKLYNKIFSSYRLMLPRKNALEEERNSIVKFIEDVEKDKRQTFLNAFDQIDKEIRLIFNKMTGGNAWLELQNEDDIFNSGISYLVQFSNKQKNESSVISNAEKTLAGIVFVLALQKLRHSSFYLIDAVDAHLDKINSEIFVNILKSKEENQYILISLKKEIIQNAKLSYVVSMKEGISNVVDNKDVK